MNTNKRPIMNERKYSNRFTAHLMVDVLLLPLLLLPLPVAPHPLTPVSVDDAELELARWPRAVAATEVLPELGSLAFLSCACKKKLMNVKVQTYRPGMG